MELRSREHTEPAYVRFQNNTGRCIDVVWINYSGALIRYGFLEPGQFIDIDTFKTHPWVFIDRRTGERMKVDSGKVFYPNSCIEISRRHGLNFQGYFRTPVPVFLPLFTLRQLSMHTIMGSLQSMNGIESLELPANVLHDILELIRNKESIMANFNVA